MTAKLALLDVASNTDKFYVLQLVREDTKKKKQFWVVKHWGRTGTAGQLAKGDPFPELQDAKKAFQAAYKLKTGRPWAPGKVFEPVEGKYFVLHTPDEPRARRTWQYYIAPHTEVDGKPAGWYNYHEDACKNMQDLYKTFQENGARMGVRVVQSGYFSYAINFAEMHQANTSSGTKRQIRQSK